MNQPFAHTILLSDLDGTLIPRGGRVSEGNRAAVERFVAGGGRFGVATGRTPEAAGGYVSGLPIGAPSVFFNGAMLYDWAEKRVLAERPLPGGDAWPRFAERCLAKFPEACIEVYTATDCNIVSNPENDDPRLPHEYYRYRHVALEEVSDIAQTPWLKFFVRDTPEHLRQLEREAAEAGIPELAHGFYSKVEYYEFVAQGTSKGAMLEAIRTLPEYQGWRIIALGDERNDVEMLRNADIGICAGGARAEVRAAADVVGCPVEDDLVAWVLDHVLADEAVARH